MTNTMVYTGGFAEVDRDVRKFMDMYGENVIELRYRVAMNDPQRLTVEIIYEERRFMC